MAFPTKDWYYSDFDSLFNLRETPVGSGLSVTDVECKGLFATLDIDLGLRPCSYSRKHHYCGCNPAGQSSIAWTNLKPSSHLKPPQEDLGQLYMTLGDGAKNTKLVFVTMGSLRHLMQSVCIIHAALSHCVIYSNPPLLNGHVCRQQKSLHSGGHMMRIFLRFNNI